MAVEIGRKVFSDGQLADLALEMAVMADSGMDFHRIVFSIASGFHGRTGDMLRTSAGMLSSGKTYPDEALVVSGLFPKYFTDMLGVGCATGKVPEALRALHTYYLKMHRLKSKARDSALQSLSMLAVSVAVFLVMTVKVLPVFAQAYLSAGMEPDTAVVWLVRLGMWIVLNWKWLTALIVVGACVFFAIGMTKTARKSLRFLAGLTRTGKAVQDARFLQSFSMGLDSGMDPIDASGMACDVAGGAERFTEARTAMKQGVPVSAALYRCRLLKEAQRQMLASGEAAGALPDTMAYVAGSAMDMAERRISRLSGLIEPVVSLIGTGLTGGVIVVAMLPLLDVMKAIG